MQERCPSTQATLRLTSGPPIYASPQIISIPEHWRTPFYRAHGLERAPIWSVLYIYIVFLSAL